MPLILVRSDSAAALWSAFATSFLDDNAAHRGPGGFPAFAWLSHRLQRDALYQAAAERGVRAWLGPPVAFYSALPRLFDVRQTPIGLLDRQHRMDALAREHGDAITAAGESTFDRRGVGRALDGMIGELLAEGVTPDQLAVAFGQLLGDPFAEQRDAWIEAVYREYRAGLDAAGRYDPRAIHAIVAARVAKGALPAAIGGARRLHCYGLTALRTRRRLMEALNAQPEVEVRVYLPAAADADEWTTVASGTERVAAAGDAPVVRVQPAPDERRELDFVTLEIKRLLVRARVQPDRIAVIVRTGRDDARAAHEALAAAGVPATARVRASFAEVPAIKALLLLFRGAAFDWPYRVLRQVFASPYFDLDLDLRLLDRVAEERRVTGLAAWARRLPAGMLKPFAEQVAALDGRRSARAWIATTRTLLEPGWFDFRRRLCRTDGDADARRAIVRLDQQGVLALADLLREWEETEPEGETITPRAWHARLRRFLQTSEIGVGTPVHNGVQVLEAHEAALFPFAHSFVLHANDGEFPRRPGTNWLFTDDELQRLREMGLPLADRHEVLRRERVLWQAVTMGPQVTISYRSADPNGVPLLPSLMVPAHEPGSEIPRTRFLPEEPVTPAQQDHAVLRDAVARFGAGQRIAAPRPEPLRRAVLAAVAEAARQLPAPGPWSGWVRDPLVLEHLAQRFDASHIWSPSRLEGYAQNPFVFFVEQVLRLQPADEADEDTSVLTIGSVTHRLLERFFAAVRDDLPFAFDAAARRRFDVLAEAALREAEGSDEWLGLRELWLARRRVILRDLTAFLAWERSTFGGRRVHLLEQAFGFDGQPEAVIDGADLAGRPAHLRLRGRVDRVDVDAAGLLHVIDYKSGQVPGRKGYEDGATLQGPLYLAALRAAGFGPPGSAAYLSVRHQKQGAELLWGAAEAERALRIALSVPARVRLGLFEPVAAASSKWKSWWPGIAICRAAHVGADGWCRFDAEPGDG